MKLSIPIDSVLGLVFALLGAGILAEAQTLAPMRGMIVGPGLFPALVGGAMAIFGVMLVIQGWRSRAVTILGEEEEQQPLVTWFAVGIGIVLAASIFVLPALGFLVGGTVLSIVIIILSGGRWLSALIFSPIAAATIYYTFTLALRVPLPRGLLG